jgi:hypothetical protein
MLGDLHHFRGVTKMVRLGSGAELAIKEFNLQLPDPSEIGVTADNWRRPSLNRWASGQF